MLVIVLAQIQISFNTNAIRVSIGPIVEDLHVAATAVGTALVIYSISVAAFVMLGSKLGKLFGTRLVFQVAIVAHGLAMAVMALSPDIRMIYIAQVIAGLASAALVPTLVVLTAVSYHGRQQAQAFGILAGAAAAAGAGAFFLAGFLGTVLSWRYSFGLLIVTAAAAVSLSFRLNPVRPQPGVKVDVLGALLAASAIALFCFGFNCINGWGFLLAKSGAPFALLGLSPVPFMIIVGVVLGQGFFVRSQWRIARERSPLLALEVLASAQERSAVYALFAVGALGTAVSFLIPLYIQIVQDRSSLFTAVALAPYALAISAAAIFSVRLYDRLAPRRLGILGFVLVAIGLTVVAFTIRNDWGTPVVILGLLVLGLGEGSLLTLLVNVLVSASRKELAGDVGALRGVIHAVSSALGTAVIGAVVVSLLSLFIVSAFRASDLPASLETEINFDNINFVTNDHLRAVLSATSATPEQVEEAARVNENARLLALKASFLILASLSLLAIFPATRLPNCIAGEIPDEETVAPGGPPPP